MNNSDLIALANATERPKNACAFEWWVAPFLIDADNTKPKKSNRRAEEQLDLFSTKMTKKLRSK